MISPDFAKSLFKKELDILKNALQKKSCQITFEDYNSLALNYKKLLNLTRRIFKISDNQGKILITRENKIKNLLDNAGQGFLTFGKDLIVHKEYSSECKRIFGQDIAKKNILDLLKCANLQQSQTLRNIFINIWTPKYKCKQNDYLHKLPNMLKINNKYITIEYKLINSLENADPLMMLILTDITDKMLAQEEVAFLSYHDKLTSLYNRAFIEKWLKNSQLYDHFPLSVILADLNGLKLTNDVFGHNQGDILLKSLADVLINNCRRQDIIARWGGDEFLILLPNTTEDQCILITQRIKDACETTTSMPIKLSVAIGSATQKEPLSEIKELFSLAENNMYNNKILESRQVHRTIILSMEETIAKRCYENTHHTKRLKKIAFKFALHIGIEENSIEMQDLLLLASLHDIGKIAIPENFLTKPGPLTTQEWEIIKKHSEIGYHIAQKINEPLVAKGILAFHERWDGKGYPNGLKDTQIPLLTRILQIIDVYDILTHEQTYRAPLSKTAALEEIKRGQGTQFDPELTNMFLEYNEELVP